MSYWIRPHFFHLSVALALTGFAELTIAQTTEERLIECASVVDEQQRLSCFEDLARGVMSMATSDDNPGQEFGLEHKEMKKDLPEIKQENGKELRKNAYGAMILMLDSGQVWEQTETKKIISHNGDAVVIERGSMSAFYRTAKVNKRIRVARIK